MVGATGPEPDAPPAEEVAKFFAPVLRTTVVGHLDRDAVCHERLLDGPDEAPGAGLLRVWLGPANVHPAGEPVNCEQEVAPLQVEVV